jgi:hypothetical protein
MRTSLLVLASLVSSSIAFAAEPITYNGRQGVFIEAEQAKKLLEIVEVEYPALKREADLLRAQVEAQKQLIEIEKRQAEIEAQISGKWKTAYDAAITAAESERHKNDMFGYVSMGVFLGGTLAGAAIMYASSMALANIPRLADGQ